MKKIFVLSVVLLSINVMFAQQNGFRKGTWGASFEDIKSAETSSLMMNIRQSQLIYKDVLSGDACEVYYIFNENDQLTNGMYHFTKDYSNPQLYVDQYDKFQGMLADKYGVDVEEKQTWHPSFRELDRSAFGKEIADGNLSLSTEWTTPTGTVKITLTKGTDMKPQVQIYYHCASVNQVAAQTNRKSALAKL